MQGGRGRGRGGRGRGASPAARGAAGASFSRKRGAGDVQSTGEHRPKKFAPGNAQAASRGGRGGGRGRGGPPGAGRGGRGGRGGSEGRGGRGRGESRGRGDSRGGRGGRGDGRGGRGDSRGGRGENRSREHSAGADRQKPKNITGNKRPAETEEPANAKRRVRHQRAAEKPNYELVQMMKLKWNRLREKHLPAAERIAIIEEILDHVRGKMQEVAAKHDSTRVIQCILQYGNKEHREQVLAEIMPKMVEFSKQPYAHFLVLKTVTYCTTSKEKEQLFGALQGSMNELAAHVIGCRVIESVLQLFPPRLVKQLKAEFYGREYLMLLEEIPSSLQDVIKARPDRASKILENMRSLLGRFLQKGVLSFAFVHHLLWEYTSYVHAQHDGEKMQDIVSTFSDSMLQLLSTKPGSKVVALIATYGTAKDRKKLVRLLKDKVLESTCHHSAYLGVSRLIDVTDDTVATQKGILAELTSLTTEDRYTASGEKIAASEPPLVAIARHRFGSKFLLRLLAPNEARYFEEDEREIFAITDVQREGTMTPVSKKSSEMRRQELLRFLRTPLEQACIRHVATLLRCRSGSRVLEEVIRVFRSAALIEAVARTVCELEVHIEEPEETKQEDDAEEEEEEDEDADEEEDEEEEKEEEEAEGEGGEDENEDEEDDEEDDDEEEEDDDAGDDSDGAEETKEGEVPAEPVEELPFYEHAVTHLVLKHLLLQEQNELPQPMFPDGAATGPAFANHLLECLTESDVVQKWMSCNRGCFVLAELCAVPDVSKKAKQFLKKAVKSLEEKPEGPGFEALKQKLA